jgi:carbonic anhydrase
VSANDLLPADRRTIRYEGSLTTPPGTEGVRWILMVEPVKLSTAQLEALEKIIKGNNRPVQDLNGRIVIQDTVAR